MTVALYRVAQESLTNVAKHAPGAAVWVRLEFTSGMVALRVANGRGPTGPGPLSSSGAGYGLDGIRERVRLLSGEVLAGPDERRMGRRGEAAGMRVLIADDQRSCARGWRPSSPASLASRSSRLAADGGRPWRCAASPP